MLNPHDGLRLSRQEDPVNKQICLVVQMYAEGAGVGEPFVFRIASEAEALRCEYVLTAVCRYVNSGGMVEHLCVALRDFFRYLTAFDCCLPAELQLINYADTEYGFQYVFYNSGQNTYCVVTEDVYAEELSPGDFLESVSDSIQPDSYF